MLMGKVLKGRQIGRTIGFPTANLKVDKSKVQLDRGVYGVKVVYKNKEYTGIMNVGLRPTFIKENLEIHYEVHIFDFHEMIYDEILNVEVCFFIRKEISFSNIEQLTTQISIDIAMVKAKYLILATIKSL